MPTYTCRAATWRMRPRGGHGDGHRFADVRIARFATDDEPRFAAVGEDRTGERVLAVLDGDPLYRPIQLTGETIPLADARLVAPVLPRSKVVGVGRNYREHAAELGNEVPAEPLLFLKPNTSVIGPGEPIVLPHQSDEVHHEAELAVGDRPDLP